MRKYPPKIEWNRAFIFYCEPDEKTGRLMSYREVAEKFGVSETSVERMGSKHDWVERWEQWGNKRLATWEAERDKMIKQLEQSQFGTWQDAVDIMQKQLMQLRSRQADSEAIDEILDDLFDELRSAKNKKERGEIKRKISNVMGRKVYAKELRETMEALRTSMNGIRITLGMPTEITKGEMTNFNRDVPLSDEELEKMDKDFAKANDQKTN